MGRKKRGFGISKWNGFGGKIEPHETFRQCAVRELREETGLIAREEDLELAGFLEFKFIASPELDHIGYIYFLRKYEGIPCETEEMEPKWFFVDQFPYDEMWKGDRTWLPEILAGKIIEGIVVFAANNEDIQSLHIEETSFLIEKAVEMSHDG